MKLKKFKKYWPLLVVLLLSWWAVKPLFHSGFFPIHDDTQVVRVWQMAQALKDGQFPVRWVADLGYAYGYPIFNFYAPLAYYAGAIFNLIGFDALTATKIMFGLGIILSGIFMYLLASQFWGKWGGIVAALFYLYAPYHAVDIYVRGAVGEFWAMAFLPLVFLGIYKMFECSNIQMFKWVIVSSLGFAGVILSHNLTAMILLPFLFLLLLVLFIFSKTKKYFILYTLYFILLALALAVFYWLPALAEMGLTKVLGQIGGGAHWQDHFVFLDQLWASPWGFGGSAPGRLDGMSFMIGKLHLAVALIGLIALFRAWFLIPFFGFLLAVFLTINYSAFIWQAIPLMAFIQYPWRFLILATFAASFMAGAIASWQPKKLHWWPGVISGIFIVGLLILNTKYFHPQTYFDLKAGDYINEENIKWKTSKISDEYLPKDFPIPQNKNEIAWQKLEVVEGEAEIEEQNIKSHRYEIIVQAKTNAVVLINTAYFPGWRVWIDDQKVEPEIESGRIKLSLPVGERRVVLKFTNTPIRTVANLVSLFSLGVWIGLVLKYRHEGD